MLTLARVRRVMPLYPVLGLLGAVQALAPAPAPAPAACRSAVYCAGELLQRVQLARIFHDSKTFVDLKLERPENETLADFAVLLRATGGAPSRDQLAHFVAQHFTDGNELAPWRPPDFDPDPPLLKQITDEKLRLFAKDIIAIWAKLGRKVSADVKTDPSSYSFLYVPNGIIVPGGRFKELYYWDSFWIIRGLLLSNMADTARGMIENLLYLVGRLGYIPNGSRVYYLGRSQPPLLAAAVASYVAATGDLAWLQRHLPAVEAELHYWLQHKKATVRVGGAEYVLLRYRADPAGRGPRPESYYEDYTNARVLPDEDSRENFYTELKSAAESGWDFSSRWFVPADRAPGNITDVHASRILPVDLNAIFAGALELAGDFRNRLKDRREAQKWWSLAKYWRGAIDAVLWHEGDGAWFDYDAQAQAPRRHFYPSCAAPLWAGAVEPARAPHYGGRLLHYLQRSGALEYPGGVPASMLHSGEQWDFPNAWPPLQSMLVGALEASGHAAARAAARRLAARWVRANYVGFSTWQKMFEKYDAAAPGRQGGGGEYGVQDGFGWTNGVALELLARYGADLALDEPPAPPPPTVRQT